MEIHNENTFFITKRGFVTLNVDISKRNTCRFNVVQIQIMATKLSGIALKY